MSALPAELYADPEIIVSNAEQGDVMPAARAVVACQGCRFKRPTIDTFGRERWHCMLSNMPGADGRCAKYGAS